MKQKMGFNNQMLIRYLSRNFCKYLSDDRVFHLRATMEICPTKVLFTKNKNFSGLRNRTSTFRRITINRSNPPLA